MPEDTLSVGDHLAGYRIEAVVGAGGVGTVYRAAQLSAERPVALKVVSTTAIAGANVRERIRRAARHASALGHEHIIPVYEAGETGGRMFVAMLYVDGSTFGEQIARRALSAREALRALRAIASALDAAHASRLVHGDIKPSNILLAASGHPYLTDFGMTTGSVASEPADADAPPSTVAPELTAGHQATVASDVYALAAVAWSCLGGRAPALDEVLARGMASRPSRRQRTAGALVAECEAAAAHVPDALLDGPATPRVAVVPTALPPLAAPEPALPPLPEPAAPAPDSAAPEPAAPDPAAPEPAAPGPAAPEPAAPPVAPEAAPPPPEPATARTRRRFDEDVARRPERAAGEPVAPPPRPAAGARARGRYPTALAIVVVVALLLIPVLLGYALGGGDSKEPAPAPQPRRLASASVRLTVPPDWKPARVELEGLDLVAPLAVRDSAGVELVTGRLRDPASGLDPTRAPLRATFSAPRGRVVRIAGRTGLLYAGDLRDGGSAWVLLLPDSAGWTAVACRGPGDLGAVCGPAAATQAAPGATPIAVAPDATLGAELRGILAKLDKARAAAHDELRARSAAVRARGALALARATARASVAVADADARPQDEPLVDGLETALANEAEALERLASAAKRNDRAAYRRRRNAVRRADEATAVALRALRRGGYVVRLRNG